MQDPVQRVINVSQFNLPDDEFNVMKNLTIGGEIDLRNPRVAQDFALFIAKREKQLLQNGVAIVFAVDQGILACQVLVAVYLIAKKWPTFLWVEETPEGVRLLPVDTGDYLDTSLRARVA